MDTYPSVNWWRGNLRHQESYLSFVVRFAHLNGITLLQSYAFLNALMGDRTHPGPEDVRRLAERICEDHSTVETMATEPIQLIPCPGSTIPQHPVNGALRYCEACAAAGYHSYLHEHRWLYLCPLHRSPLKVLNVDYGSGSMFNRTGMLLAQVMTSACPRWPTANDAFRPQEFAGVAWLAQWTRSASAKAIELTKHTVWSSQPAIFQDTPNVSKAIGQLHAIDPVPAAMQPLFEEFDDDWAVEVRHLSAAAREATAWIAANDFQALFWVYQRLTAYAESTHPVVAALDACRAALQARHAQCRCRWGRESPANSAKQWVPTHPEDWPMCTLMCPNAAAREQLELAFGRCYELLSGRRQYEERVAVYAVASNYVAQGLIKFTDEQDMAAHDKEGWRNVTWVGNPGLNEMLEAITCTEIKLAQQALLGWLDSIDAGRHPARYTASCRGPHLCKTPDTLDLVAWSRARSRC